MFELVINSLVIDSFPTFEAANEKMDSIMRRNGYTIFRVDFSRYAIARFHWQKVEGPYILAEIKDT